MYVNLLLTLTICSFSFFFLSRVQGSSQVQESAPLDLHEDECLVRLFGETADHGTLVSLVHEAPLSKIVDAFIECPSQMAYIYFDKLKFSLIEEYDIVNAVIDSNKVEQFYISLRNFPGLEDLQPPISRDASMRHSSRAIIYMLSFVHDIPAHLYLDSLKQDVVMYARTLMEKAIYCKTPESKNWITNRLNEALLMLKSNTESVLPGNINRCSKMVVYTIKCVNGEDFDFDSIDSSDNLGLIFYSLWCNRYDVAEAACKGSKPLNLQTAVIFATKRSCKRIEDLPRAFNILKSIMQSDADRVAFDEHVRNRL